MWHFNSKLILSSVLITYLTYTTGLVKFHKVGYAQLNYKTNIKYQQLRSHTLIQPNNLNIPTNLENQTSHNIIVRSQRYLSAVWAFTRPHTIIGSTLSIFTLFLYATSRSLWFTSPFNSAIKTAMISSLLMNVYITGLNQITDIEIDKVNKPYLPLASGSLTKQNGIIIVLLSFIVSIWAACFGKATEWPLQLAVLGSAVLGTAYSLPPFRLKRFPLLAAVSILLVRGTLINLGFFLHAKMAIESIKFPSVISAVKAFPQATITAGFFAIFGLVIALMKDVPDTDGDIKSNIRTYSVKLGPSKMFGVSTKLLSALLLSASVAIGSTMNASHLSSPFRAIPMISSAWLSFDVLNRAKLVNTENPKEIFSYYMYTWNIFYFCYLMLPFLR